jgi:hypothetical protein
VDDVVGGIIEKFEVVEIIRKTSFILGSIERFPIS